MDDSINGATYGVAGGTRHQQCFCEKGMNNADGDSTFISKKIHPCDLSDRGGCHQLCIKDGDDAVCSCNKGYEVSNSDPKKCVWGKLK